MTNLLTGQLDCDARPLPGFGMNYLSSNSEQAEKERKKNKKKGKLKLDVELECASAEASTPLTANKLQALPPARPAQSRPITTEHKMGLG